MAFPRKNSTGKIQLGTGNPTNEALITPARQYIALLEAREYSRESTRKRWECMRRFLRYLEAVGIERVQDVSLDHIEGYRHCLVEHEYSGSVIESSMRTVSLFFRFLEEGNMVFDNPARRLHIPKANVPFGPVLTEREVNKLLAGPDLTRTWGVRDRALLETLYSTGVRRAEAVSLTVFDVDLERATLRVKGKGRKQRLIPLGKHAVKFLRLYLNDARPRMLPKFTPPPELLWLDRNRTGIGGPGISHILKHYGELAKITKPVNTHTLRRTCATHLLRGGAHPAVVAQLLGHASLNTLSHYLQTTITDLMKAHAQTKPGK